MPYCRQCGAELWENIKFCPNCGTPVGPPVTSPVAERVESVEKVEKAEEKVEESVEKAEEKVEERVEKKVRKPITPLTIFLIVIVGIGAVLAALVFLPVLAVNTSKSYEITYEAGIDTIDLDFTADAARVNVAFEDLDDELFTLNVSASGRGGIFVSTEPFSLDVDDTTEYNVLTVTSEVDVVDSWPWHAWLHVTCDICIDVSLNASLNVKTGVGKIVLATQAGVVLKSLSLETTTGEVEADLVQGVIVSDDVSVTATTGKIGFSWSNVIMRNDVLVDIETTTGEVNVDVKQHGELLRDVILDVEATTGGIDFTIDIKGDVGARIESNTTIAGGIDVDRQLRFSGEPSSLRSHNYPAGGNFDVSLKTTTGGIDIDAKYVV